MLTLKKRAKPQISSSTVYTDRNALGIPNHYASSIIPLMNVGRGRKSSEARNLSRSAIVIGSDHFMDRTSKPFNIFSRLSKPLNLLHCGRHIRSKIGNQALSGERPVETWEGTVRILGCHYFFVKGINEERFIFFLRKRSILQLAGLI